MTTSFLNESNISQELVTFIRNQDVLTISERGVTTSTDTGTFASDSTHLIAVSDVKNIRSITVGGGGLALGTDYTYNTNFDDSGTKKCKITFTSAQTGSFSIPYDHGTDKIWPDFPRDDLSISSYPRIAVDTQDSGTDTFGIGGNAYITDMAITIVVYAATTSQLDSLVTSIRTKMITNNQSFFYLNFIKPVGIGPAIIDPTSKKEIMSKNVDFLAQFLVETIT